MKKSSFGIFLNEWGRSLARYGSSIIKFIEKDGELFTNVMPWNRMIVDSVDFVDNPKVEKIWTTPAQLRKNENYDQDLVEKLIDAVEVRETMDGQKKDNKADYIVLYEIHGELPLSYLTDREEDETVYRQQMHVISFLDKKDEGEFDDHTLIKGKESIDPFMITHLIEEDGRTQSIGAVENLFEVQWMENHTVKTIKDQLDLASKMVFQTSDGKFVGQNVLTSIEQGDILIHQLNQPLTQLNNRADISALQAQGAQWKAGGNEIVGISEAMLGTAPKSGTAWRQTEALLFESHSLFEIMTENKGLDIERMMRLHIIPFIIKNKMNNSEEISATLEEHQITQIDSMYVPKKAIKDVNNKIIEAALKGLPFTREQQDTETIEQTERIQEGLRSFGNKRFITPSDITTETWKAYFKNFEWVADVNITGEAKDRQSLLTTLTTIFQTLAVNPMVLEDPRAKLVFNRIINEVGGVSPIEMAQVPPPPEEEPVSPRGGRRSGAELESIKQIE